MIIIRPNMKKKWYEAPDTQVLEVRNEGMICASGDAGPEGGLWNKILHNLFCDKMR